MRHILSIILLLTSILISVADDNKELAQSNTGNQAHIGVTSDINIQANSKANAEVPRLDSLNKVLSHRQEYVGSKQRFIASLESRLKVASNDNDRLQALNELYNEYSTFRFDSAMVKVEQMMEIAQKANRKEYEALSNIYMATY